MAFTAFQTDAFQNNAFQTIEQITRQPGGSGPAGYYPRKTVYLRDGKPVDLKAPEPVTIEEVFPDLPDYVLKALVPSFNVTDTQDMVAEANAMLQGIVNRYEAMIEADEDEAITLLLLH